MTAEEFREKQDFEYEHFLELTDSGNKPDYYNIEQFAENYHQAKLKLLGIGDVSKRFSIGEKVIWKERYYLIQRDNGKKKVLIKNTEESKWVYRDEVNAC